MSLAKEVVLLKMTDGRRESPHRWRAVNNDISRTFIRMLHQIARYWHKPSDISIANVWYRSRQCLFGSGRERALIMNNAQNGRPVRPRRDDKSWSPQIGLEPHGGWQVQNKPRKKGTLRFSKTDKHKQRPLFLRTRRYLASDSACHTAQRRCSSHLTALQPSPDGL